MKKIKIIGILFCLFIFFFVTVRPLFSDGYFPMHDDTQIARVVVMGRALEHGQFPVRIVGGLGYGYGYPIFNYYGPLPYYIGGIVYTFHIDPIVSTKVMMGLGILIGIVSAYFLGTFLYGKTGGLLASGAFALFPYRAVQLYVRGAIGELWATSCIPLVVLGYLLLANSKKRVYATLISIIGISGVILSHTVYAYILVGILILYILCSIVIDLMKKQFQWKEVFLRFIPLLVSLDVTAFFWLPAFVEMKYTNVTSVIGQSASIFNHFVCPMQFIDSPWGFGGSAPGCFDGMSFKLGKMHIILVVFSILTYFSIRKKKLQTARKGFFIGLILIVGSIFFMIPESSFIWNGIPYGKFIQYPWRFLAVTGVGILCVVPFFLSKVPVFLKRFFVGIALVLLIIVNRGVFQPQYIYKLSSGTATSVEDISFRASSISDEYLPADIPKPKIVKDVVFTRVNGDETMNVSTIKETEIFGQYEVIADTDTSILLRMAAIPGWVYRINGNIVNPQIENGMPRVILSKGHSVIEVQYENTGVRIVANVLSIITLVLLGIYYGKKINS